MPHRCKMCRGVWVEEWARVRIQVHRLHTPPHMANTVHALTLALSTSLTCKKEVSFTDPFARSHVCCCHADGGWLPRSPSAAAHL